MYWNFSEILRGREDGRFSRADGPLSLEIGFGNGEYIERTARAERGSLAVGIEVSQWCLAKAARRVIAAGLDNVRLMLGDARHLLKWAFEPSCVDAVYMNYPCPWPKRRHAERRVTTNLFARLVRSRLVAGGSFNLLTDVGWYAAEARETFARAGFSVSAAERGSEPDCMTKYGRKWREMGREVYSAVAVKTGEAAGDFELEDDMGEHSAEFEPAAGERASRADKPIREALASLVGDKIEGRDYIALFREIFFAGDGTALIGIISVDEGFEQHYRIRVITEERRAVGRRATGSIDTIGCPYRTPGVRASLKHISAKTGVIF
ncbi:tRNA (guanine-N(7)-)-methyltransferase [Synergistales bacterium]|nr:tRNA (guanine-N(7)-)-methyltransferase [Synergistales bacterium]GHV52953.1 tRNA (guanine-N(7)-)-methyltransferase [Synergistales bacterium]